MDIAFLSIVLAVAMILMLAFFGMSNKERTEVSRLPLADGLSEDDLPEGMSTGA